jgi:hypothetical protein
MRCQAASCGSQKLGAGVHDERARATASDDDARQIEAREAIPEIDGQM